VFFIFEQPVSRKRYIAIKFLHGACHVAAATLFAALLAPAVVYAMMLIGVNVTAAGSGAAFAEVMAAAARATIGCSLMAVCAFAACALIAALAPRFWLAMTASVVLIALYGSFSSDYFDIPFPTGQPLSVSANMSSQWINISRALTPAEVADFAHWKALPLLVPALVAVVFCLVTALLYERKELK